MDQLTVKELLKFCQQEVAKGNGGGISLWQTTMKVTVIMDYSTHLRIAQKIIKMKSMIAVIQTKKIL